MNRIRKYNDKWQVLITPTQHYNPQFEILLGGWTDENLRNFYIKEYSTLNDAQSEAFNHPDIDWMKMVLMYKSSYHELKNQIQNNLKKHNFVCDFIPQYMEPEQVKNSVFNRVMLHQDRFRLVYHMNDIISFNIINPWSKNIYEIADKLSKDKNLKIIKSIESYGMIHLIGKTDLGTTYEIGIWTTLLSNWARWKEMNSNVSNEIKKKTYNEIIKKQKELDTGINLR